MRWLGHVLRMPPDRLPRLLLHYEPAQFGHTRPPGRPVRTWRAQMCRQLWDVLRAGRDPRARTWRIWQREWLVVASELAQNRHDWRQLTRTVLELERRTR